MKISNRGCRKGIRVFMRDSSAEIATSGLLLGLFSLLIAQLQSFLGNGGLKEIYYHLSFDVPLSKILNGGSNLGQRV